jgi:hypothetical protein
MYEVIDQIQLVQDRVQWRVYLSRAMDLRVPQKEGNFRPADLHEDRHAFPRVEVTGWGIPKLASLPW